ncbi:MAG: hypothetical protein ACRDXX_18120 [Stackebrandtia sp.]
MTTPTDVERALARRAARLAARFAKPVSVCPYDPHGDTTRERLLADEFVREYRRHVPSATDYTT